MENSNQQDNKINENKNALTGLPLYILIAVNFLLTISLATALFHKLKQMETVYQNQEKPETALDTLSSKQAATSTFIKDTTDTTKAGIEAYKPSDAPTVNRQPANDKYVTFLDILLLMLLAGSLGGVLCNLRGFFIHYRGEEKHFPKHLEVPYYTRAFLGAGAGLFIYFVANFLVSSTTVSYQATNIPFQGMVSFIALALLAGFGSLEFFQRMKETALTFFGQKTEKDKWQQIEELFALYKKEVISEDEFNAEKAKILTSSSELERQMMEKINVTQVKKS